MKEFGATDETTTYHEPGVSSVQIQASKKHGKFYADVVTPTCFDKLFQKVVMIVWTSYNSVCWVASQGFLRNAESGRSLEIEYLWTLESWKGLLSACCTTLINIYCLAFHYTSPKQTATIGKIIPIPRLKATKKSQVPSACSHMFFMRAAQ